MSRITAIALSAFLALLLGGGLPTFGADEEKKPAGPAASSQAENKGKLRGTGMLILDPRDDLEKAKEQLRLLLEQIQSHIPERMRRQANRRQLDALLASDWSDPETLPELAFVFDDEMTAVLLHQFIVQTQVGKASEEYCQISCALEEIFDQEGVHIHLTRPSGGPGDTVLAVEFYDSVGPEGISDAVLEAEVLEFRSQLRDNWEEFGYDREPIGRIFGVRVVVGDPRVGADWMPPN